MKNRFLRTAASAVLTVLLVLTLLPQRALAAGATLTGTSALLPGDTVTLTLSVPSKVYGLSADLSYSSNLSLSNYNCSVSGWSIVMNNNKFSAYGTSSSSGGVVTIKMKVSSGAKEGDALSAAFSNVVVSDGNSDTDLGSASWSGKITAAPSGNCDLSSLSCSNATLSPSFSAKTTYYTCTVPFAVEKLELNYKKADNTSSVSVSGNELAVGANTVTVKVTAANGTTKTYTIDVTRQQDPNYKASTDAALSTLTIEGATLSPTFTPTVTDYIAYVPFETRQVTIAAAAKDEKAQGVTGTGAVQLSATESETVVTVTGTAEDGKTKQAYTIHVLRMPAYTGIVPTVEVIDPATIPAVAPLEIPGTLTLPLLGEVRTLYVAIAVAVLLVIVLFLLGFLIGRGHAGSANDYEDDEPQEPQPPVLEKHRTASVPRLVPRQEEPAEEPQPVRQPAAVTAAPAEEPAPAPKAGGTLVGSLSAPFTAYVPETMRPEVTLETAVVNDNAAVQGWGVCLQGVSRMQYTAEATAMGGASVQEYRFRFAGQEITGASGTTGAVGISGTLTPVVTVTDSRGRTTTVSSTPVTVCEYHTPVITASGVVRCGADGTEKDDGAYLKVRCAASCSEVQGHNSVQVRARMRPMGGQWSGYTELLNGAEQLLGGGLSPTASYEVELSAVDAVGGVRTVRYTASTSQVTMHLRSGGKGAAFGKYSEGERLECAWPAVFYGDVAVSGALTVNGETVEALAYPVGSVRLTDSAAPPETAEGLTWESVETGISGVYGWRRTS